MVAGPNFICIGLQKAGTQWLYDQLQFHPDVWMPPVKEFHYFDRQYPGIFTPRRGDFLKLKEFAKDPEESNKKRAKRKLRPLDERDLEFFRTLKENRGGEKSVEHYRGLFDPKGTLVSGDITPGYSRLAPDVIREISVAFPELRVVLLLRDPVQRMISATLMIHRRGGLTEQQLLDDEVLRTFAAAQRRESRSYPSAIAERWAESFGPRFRYFFFDDIVSRPDDVRRDIFEFIGVNPAKPSGDLPAGFNRKAKSTKPQISPQFEGFLVEHYREELCRCAKLFGGPAHDWLTRYGLSIESQRPLVELGGPVTDPAYAGRC